MAVSCIVLAAGMSRRLGTPKQLLEFRGRPILQAVIDEAAQSCADDVVVVLGHESHRIEAALSLPASCRVVLNDRYADGQSTSLAAGVHALGTSCEAGVVVLGDQPGVRADVYDEVIERWRATGADAVRTLYGGRPGHPVLLARRLFATLGRLAGDVGARAVLDRPGVTVVEVNRPGPAPVDIDTREDYEALLGGA